MAEEIESTPTRTLKLDRLVPLPRNYREHPPDQIEHLQQSLRENGWYRNIVAANDYTILAGHGITRAASEMGIETGPVKKMPYGPDDPRALKLLAADNTVAGFAVVDDRALTELLREVKTSGSLLGTGFDDASLAALVMVTRPASEIADFDVAAEWVGMPEFDHAPKRIDLIIHFDSDAGRDEIIEALEVKADEIRHGREVWSMYWPPRTQDDVENLIFE